jgi:uncharacterized protein YunC (DUF1805 family)
LDDSLGVNELVGLALKCGEVNLRAMELLDAATRVLADIKTFEEVAIADAQKAK